MLIGKSLVVVGEILPLIIEPRVGSGREGVSLVIRLAIREERSLITVIVALGDAETEAAGDNQTLDRLEIRKQYAMDIDALA